MMVRQFHWGLWDVYTFYNADCIDENGNLPPPPNPTGLQLFLMACLEVTIDQINQENDPDGKNTRKRRREQQDKQATFQELKSQAMNGRI